MNVFDLQAVISLNTSKFDSGLKDAGSKMSSFAKSVSNLPNTIGQNVSKAGSFISGVGSSLESKITKPATAATAAVSGIFLAKGWGRLTQIDEAKAKLRGLGHDGESVKGIMDSALASVRGTAFGMDEAATTAASAVAAGIEKGEDLTKYLTTVGDAAAIAGTSMGDMGAIFNKVTTAGKAQNDVLGQLADKGIPIYQWLAEETGHAADEIFDMAKDGEINLATFRAAIEKHVGGAAKELGNATLTGALANVWAAVSRVGANFLGAADDADSFAGKLLPVIIKAQDALGVLEEKAKEWGAVFGDVFGGLIDYFSKGSADISQMGDSAQKVWSVIQPILDKIKSAVEFLSGMSPELLGTLAGLAVGAGPVIKYGGEIVNIIGLMISNGGLLIAGISLLVGALGYFVSTGQDTSGVMQTILDGITNFGEKVPEVVDKIKEGLSQVWDMIPEILDSALDVGADIITYLLDGLAENMPALMDGAADIIATLISNITENAPKLIESAATVIGEFLAGIGAELPRLVPMALEMLLTVVEGLIDNADKIVDGAIALVTGLTTGIINAIPILIEKIPEIISKMIEYIKEDAPRLGEAAITCMENLGQAIIDNFPIVGSALDSLQEFFSNTGDAIKTAFDKMAEFLEPVKNALNAFKEFAKAVFDDVVFLVKALVDGIKALFDRHRSEINMLISTVKFAITGFITNIKLIIGVAIDFFKVLFKGTFDFIAGIFKTFAALLKGDVKGATDAIKGIVKTFIDTTLGLFNSLKSRLTDWASDMKSNFLSWGKDMIQNFIDGIRGMIDRVKDAATDIANAVKDFIGFSEPEKGPLSNFHTYAPDMMDLFAQGIKDNTKRVTDQIKSSFDFSDVIVSPNIKTGGALTGGSVMINVYAAPGQSEEEIADIVMDRMQHKYDMGAAVYA